jgi:hypothetical protein
MSIETAVLRKSYSGKLLCGLLRKSVALFHATTFFRIPQCSLKSRVCAWAPGRHVGRVETGGTAFHFVLLLKESVTAFALLEFPSAVMANAWFWVIGHVYPFQNVVCRFNIWREREARVKFNY